MVATGRWSPEQRERWEGGEEGSEWREAGGGVADGRWGVSRWPRTTLLRPATQPGGNKVVSAMCVSSSRYTSVVRQTARPIKNAASLCRYRTQTECAR